jgi:hypothetical protein
MTNIFRLAFDAQSPDRVALSPAALKDFIQLCRAANAHGVLSLPPRILDETIMAELEAAGVLHKGMAHGETIYRIAHWPSRDERLFPEPAEKKRRTKPRTALAADWEIVEGDACYQSAIDAGMTWDEMNLEEKKFKAHHQAKGSLMADWPAAWRTWCCNFVAFKARRQ